ncbi:MAG: pilus assembly protein [Telluria sp.]
MTSPRRIMHAAGAVLVTTLILMVLVLLMGLAASRLASHGQKAALFEGNRQTAFAAAEAALTDAERDIAGPDSGAPGRQSMFATGASLFSEHCGRGADDLGLCLAKPDSQPPDWQATDLAQDDTSTVALGAYTGARMASGGVGLPARLPRYLIELLPTGVGVSGTLYRVTAIGFGERAGIQVVLQSIYHRAAAGAAPPPGNHIPAGRVAWREVDNWQELHKHAIQ